MIPLETVLGNFAAARILVVGDIMLDRFVYGRVSRISPEAPAPVIHAVRTEEVLGGAGNVVRNIDSLGARAEFIGVVGNDDGARAISAKLEAQSSIHANLIQVPGRPTTVKTRFVSEAHNTHLLRADWEDTSPIAQETENVLIAAVAERLSHVDAVILSDYNKGVLTPRLIGQIIAAARAAGKPVVVDPKGTRYDRYRGVTALTPNLAELSLATGHPVENTDEALKHAGRELIEATDCETLLITRSERGVLALESSGEASAFPANAPRVVDVSGAGDTLVASFTLALVAGAGTAGAAQVANSAAGIVVTKAGTAHVLLSELREKLLSRPRFHVHSKVFGMPELLDTVATWRNSGLLVGFTNGCFDILHPGHVELLRAARAHCDRLIVGLNSDQSVKRLKGETRPIQNENARATVLAALSFVDAVVIFGEDTPYNAISEIVPDVLVKGADYTIDKVVGRDVVEAHGGRVVLAELVPNSSTTGIVQKMRSADEPQSGQAA
ncbi:D-alpha,beta-D-heptose 7-phosphate 1-kinase /D-beta-D-heptose 1-phosphate adenylyltransferase [Faunimonas pinastri]|uniref:Bifunctional protein HldE n=1 Tax=Faunimonas pinastri TaxID=1855383 RepID=A0A1H9PN82_9HYPH|nr:D-glycero-beta-D-manno-heptose-7-phosphate kinase [Faunimonas pinastri]SER49269.1 D-alpha,beta-D-heptose 7-phosphate 1-kinase /D-beta-D-heptose 1-phosphate adenylyltransferase [Faunimonas pinastri]